MGFASWLVASLRGGSDRRMSYWQFNGTCFEVVLKGKGKPLLGGFPQKRPSHLFLKEREHGPLKPGLLDPEANWFRCVAESFGWPTKSMADRTDGSQLTGAPWQRKNGFLATRRAVDMVLFMASERVTTGTLFPMKVERAAVPRKVVFKTCMSGFPLECRQSSLFSRCLTRANWMDVHGQSRSGGT